MLTKEEVDEEVSGEIIGESNNFYKVRDGDEITYTCKYCGESGIPKSNLAAHLNTCEKAPKEVKGHRPKKGERRGSGVREEEEEEGRLLGLTFEDEVVEAMARELYEQLKITPGCKNSKDKIEWVVRWFAHNPTAQNNPQKLYEVLSKTFKAADDEAINFIVDSVFAVKQNYQQERRGYRGRFSRPAAAPNFPPTFDFDFQAPMGDPSTFALSLMYQMWRDIQESRRNNESSINPEEIKKMVEAEVERRILREEVERLRETVNHLLEERGRPRTSEGGWGDDYARLIAELGSQILELGEKMIIENKKFRTALVKHLLPKLAGREGEDGMMGEGKTDDEIYEELAKEGFADVE